MKAKKKNEQVSLGEIITTDDVNKYETNNENRGKQTKISKHVLPNLIDVYDETSDDAPVFVCIQADQ